MHKRIFGRQLKRDTNERKALFKGLMNALVMHERLETTEAKAKAIRAAIEKLVTKAKDGEKARPLLIPVLNEQATEKMLTVIGPRFATRPGGYVRIIKIGNRLKDNAEMAVIEFVEKSVISTEKKEKKHDKTIEAKIVATETKKEVKKVAPTKMAERKAVKTQQKKGTGK